MSELTQFFVYDALVEFKFSAGIDQEIELFSCVVPPTRPGRVERIPLFLALRLYKQQRGYVMVPDFLQEEALQQKLQDQKLQEGFVAIDENFIPLSKILLELFAEAPDIYPQETLQRTDALRNELILIRQQRWERLQASVAPDMDLTNLTQFELDAMVAWPQLPRLPSLEEMQRQERAEQERRKHRPASD